MTETERKGMGVSGPSSFTQKKPGGTPHLAGHEVLPRGLAYSEVIGTHGRLDLQQPGSHRGARRREFIGISSRCHAPRHDFARGCFLNASKAERKKHVA